MEKKQKVTKPNTPVFLTVNETAEYLSVKVSTIYNYLHKRVIPFYKPLRKVYFRIEDLNNFILNENNLVKSNQQLEEEATKHILNKGAGGGK